MADTNNPGDVHLYKSSSGNMLVERNMLVSKKGNPFPMLKLKKAYTKNGELKMGDSFFPSEIEELIDLLRVVKDDNEQYIFKHRF